jgi:hypothetical protein
MMPARSSTSQAVIACILAASNTLKRAGVASNRSARSQCSRRLDGEANQQCRHDSEKYAVEWTRTANRGDGSSQLPHAAQAEEVGPNQAAEAPPT